MWHFSLTFPGFTLMPGCRYKNKVKLWQVSSYRCNLPYFLLYVHWKPDILCIIWSEAIIHAGLARLPVVNPMGEPNTPLAFRRRDACQLKQQAGHVKIVVGSGQDTENPILWYGRLYFGTVLIVSTEKSVRAFNQVVLSKNCCFRSERASKIALRYLNRKSSSKHTQLFCRTLYISKPYLLYMMLIFVSPIFGIGLPCL